MTQGREGSQDKSSLSGKLPLWVAKDSSCCGWLGGSTEPPPGVGSTPQRSQRTREFTHQHPLVFLSALRGWMNSLVFLDNQVVAKGFPQRNTGRFPGRHSFGPWGGY